MHDSEFRQFRTLPSGLRSLRVWKSTVFDGPCVPSFDTYIEYIHFLCLFFSLFSLVNRYWPLLEKLYRYLFVNIPDWREWNEKKTHTNQVRHEISRRFVCIYTQIVCICVCVDPCSVNLMWIWISYVLLVCTVFFLFVFVSIWHANGKHGKRQ